MTFFFNVSNAFQEMKSELKMKFDGQVTLYRNYRVGDLPDIQIEHSSLIAPLQALAQVCVLFKCHFCVLVGTMRCGWAVAFKIVVLLSATMMCFQRACFEEQCFSCPWAGAMMREDAL